MHLRSPFSLALVPAALVAIATTLCAVPSTVQARPILIESAYPTTGVRLDGVYIPGKGAGLAGVDYTGIDLVLSGSYKFNKLLGVEASIPLGFFKPDTGESKTVLGNADIAGRVGYNLNLGVMSLAVGGALHLYVPTSSGDFASQLANGALAIGTINRPGLRAFKDFTVQPTLAASLGIAMLDVYASVGPSIMVPTDDGDTVTTLQGGIGAMVTPFPLIGICAEFLGSQPFEDGQSALYQVAAGVQVHPPVVNIGANVRIPVDEASRNIASVIVGFDISAAF